MSTSERTPLLSGTINGPTGRQVQNALPSKGQRIKVAEAIGAFQAGKLPSQQQISQIIQTILDSDTIKTGGGTNSRTARLGREGQQVLQNFRRVLSATKAWGEDKNDNDLLQNFFYNATTADIDIDINTPNAPSKQEMSKDSKRAIESARSIASLIVTNPAFRQLGSDAILITRDLFADAAFAAADQAGKAAEQARPSEAERKDGVDFENLSKKGKKTAKGLASGRIQGEIKESIWDELENGKHWVDENIPAADEAKDKVISRVQQVITAAQKDPEYRRSVTAIVNIFKKYANKAQEALDETKEKSAISDEDEKVQQAGRDLRTFVERITNKSLDDVVSAAQKAGEDIKNDEKLGKYFKELENYLDRLLYQPGYVASNAAYKKASSLYDDAQSLLAENEQWKKDAGELQKQLEEVVEGVKNDKPTLELVDALEDLANSLATAGQIGLGSLKVDGQGLYRDFVDVIVPRLIALVKEIPVPRVEFKSEDVDLVIDDIKLESASFIPDSVRFVQHNDLQFTQGYATYASEYDATLRLRVEGLHFSASNIAFWISKKTGFMPFQDSGILDIEFGPKGINFDVTLENADEDDRESFFTVKKVDVTIEGFDYHLRDHEKWFATWFAKPILRAFIKRNLTHALEVQISENLRTADLKMFAVQQRAIAATNARPSAANFVNAVFRDSIFPQSSTTGPVEVKSTGVVKYGRHGEYILHVGVDEELFPDQPPARVSNKQREKAKAAVKNTTRQAKGSAEQFKKEAQNAADKGKKEVNELDARKKEQQRRESKSEGWRTDAFSV